MVMRDRSLQDQYPVWIFYCRESVTSRGLLAALATPPRRQAPAAFDSLIARFGLHKAENEAILLRKISGR